MTHTISECLGVIGVEIAMLEECDSLTQEFSVIKRCYFKQILTCHPDKGGDAAVFRQVQTSFEVLREMYATGRVLDSFTIDISTRVADDYDETYQDFGDMPTPSWGYYYEAAEEEVPLYRVELAKSNRSGCVKCKAANNRKRKPEDYVPRDEKIEKGVIRVGSLDEKSGTYARWSHLDCWRVPSRVWLGLPDPESCTDPKKFEHALIGMNEMLFCGLEDLNEQDKAAVVAHVMDKGHWARLLKKRKQIDEAKTAADTSNAAAAVTEQTESSETKLTSVTEAKAMVATGRKREVFIPPIPGVNGVAANAMAGKRVVLTGTFPEVGGGVGLNMGKDKVKRMVENLGGRVTSAVSGKTDILLVGKEPGFSKVSKARERGIELLTLKDWKDKLEGSLLEGEERPVVITNFSSGYNNNSLALMVPPEARAAAAGAKKAPAQPSKKAKRAALDEAGSPKKKAARETTSKAEAKSKAKNDSTPPSTEDTQDPPLAEMSESRELVVKVEQATEGASKPNRRRSGRRQKQPLGEKSKNETKPPKKKTSTKKTRKNKASAGAENTSPATNTNKTQPKKKPAKKAANVKKTIRASRKKATAKS